MKSLFSEVSSSIPVIDRIRLASIRETLHGKSHDEILALVPEIQVIELDNAQAAGASSVPLCVLCWNGERGRFVVECVGLPQRREPR